MAWRASWRRRRPPARPLGAGAGGPGPPDDADDLDALDLDALDEPEEVILPGGGRWRLPVPGASSTTRLPPPLPPPPGPGRLPGPPPGAMRPPGGPPPSPAGPPPPPTWEDALRTVQTSMLPPGAGLPGRPPGRQILYVVNARESAQQGLLTLDVVQRDRRRDGEWALPKALELRPYELEALPDAADRELLALLAGPRGLYDYGSIAASRYRLPAAIQRHLMPRIVATGRCRLRQGPEDRTLRPLAWDGDGAWELWLALTPAPGGPDYRLTGQLRRGAERLELAAPALLTAEGLVIAGDRVAPLDDGGAFAWVPLLRQHGAVAVPAAEAERWLGQVLALRHVPRLDLPEALRYEDVPATPRPRLRIGGPSRPWGPDRLRATLAFDYEGHEVGARSPQRGLLVGPPWRHLRRDGPAEAAAAGRLAELGVGARPAYYGEDPEADLEVTPRHLGRVVSELVRDGWQVEAEGVRYRGAGAFRLEVRSGVDWLDLDGSVEFDGARAPVPRVLQAIRRGERTVRLDDGTHGLLPDEWLARYGLLAGLAEARGPRLRLRPNQVGLLDAVLAGQAEVTWDPASARVREELARFAGVAPEDPSPGFAGQLRGYQREGLGWLRFLQAFGWGGCLADDMGLGKTVQVLALLEARRAARSRGAGRKRGAARGPRPALVVVPRSLVFNWKAEAARFAPKLRVLDHTGLGRGRDGEGFAGHDLVLTTYGTLRRDVAGWSALRFDYVILDEAQAIKNPATESARAARLLRADHRLALSGTPVQNHLGELWSLFEFLNPGMLGSPAALGLDGAAARSPAPATREALARAIRPFVLRRTKAQVAGDLPPKVEQTLYCELEPAQRALYDELRDHYRQGLLARVARDGLARSRFAILEALLRLRQAACHPGLLDRGRQAEPSAKLDVLLPRLAELREEGHKALVFSQFTSLLAIVRQRLQAEGLPHLYLDGKTRDREDRVRRFQEEPGCPLFLVSLTAGGLGLNLTAAEYVFLLDPWWNPAVEAQAIDRTHRIGQERPVFAYRLIARDTVEEKVLALQATKRELAEGIIRADDGALRALTREDLHLLLS